MRHCGKQETGQEAKNLKGYEKERSKFLSVEIYMKEILKKKSIYIFLFRDIMKL